MAEDRPPVHSWEGTESMARVFKKTGLYGSELICTLYTGSFTQPNKNIDARSLANALCDYLESRRPPAGPSDPGRE